MERLRDLRFGGVRFTDALRSRVTSAALIGAALSGVVERVLETDTDRDCDRSGVLDFDRDGVRSLMTRLSSSDIADDTADTASSRMIIFFDFFFILSSSSEYRRGVAILFAHSLSAAAITTAESANANATPNALRRAVSFAEYANANANDSSSSSHSHFDYGCGFGCAIHRHGALV